MTISEAIADSLSRAISQPIVGGGGIPMLFDITTDAGSDITTDAGDDITTGQEIFYE